jgi:hypothetical protein
VVFTCNDFSSWKLILSHIFEESFSCKVFKIYGYQFFEDSLIFTDLFSYMCERLVMWLNKQALEEVVVVVVVAVVVV